MIAAVLGQGLLESEKLVHLIDDCKIRAEAPPKINTQVRKASVFCMKLFFMPRAEHVNIMGIQPPPHPFLPPL